MKIKRIDRVAVLDLDLAGGGGGRGSLETSGSWHNTGVCSFFRQPLVRSVQRRNVGRLRGKSTHTVTSFYVMCQMQTTDP